MILLLIHHLIYHSYCTISPQKSQYLFFEIFSQSLSIFYKSNIMLHKSSMQLFFVKIPQFSVRMRTAVRFLSQSMLNFIFKVCLSVALVFNNGVLIHKFTFGKYFFDKKNSAVYCSKSSKIQRYKAREV